MAIILCGFTLYFIPLHSAFFYFDDISSIVNNEAIRKIDIPTIFNAFNTRFLVGLSFAFNYQWGGLHPFGYRFINLIIHCLNAFLVYVLAKELKGAPIPAFFASMLFLCHPLQTEPVNSITQRFVLMGTFFYLLTLFLYIQYRCRSQKRYMIAALGSAMAAMFCKEFTVTLPFMLALYDFYFLRGVAETWWKRCNRILPFFVIILIVPILLLRTPPETIGVANIADTDSIHHIDITRAQGKISRKQYFLTELNVVCTYVRLLFLPVNQNLDYDYPLSHAMNGGTFLSGIFLFCLLVLAVITYKSYRIVSFGILWFFIALSVESSFIPIGHVIAEYRLYLASVGFVFLVTALLYEKKVTGAISKKLHLSPFLVLIGFSILTYQRNNIWKDGFTLWNDTVQKSPHKARAFNNRGNAYIDQGKVTRALSDYSKAIELDPNYADAYYDRGIIYNNQGKVTQALSDFTKAIKIYPYYEKAFIGRGIIYAQQGHLTEGLSNFNMAIKINPWDAQAINGRGIIYSKQGNLTQTIADFNKAIEINPKYVEAYYNRAIIYYQLKEYDKAWTDIQKAQELGKAINPILINDLKKALGKD